MLKIQVSLFKQALVIGGHPVETPLGLHDLVRLIGPADRASGLENTIYTWDQLGLLAYQAPGEGTLLCLSICFRARAYDFAPRTPFSGMVQLNGTNIHAAATRSHLLEAGLQPEEFLPFLYVGACEHFEILAEFRGGLVNVAVDWSED